MEASRFLASSGRAAAALSLSLMSSDARLAATTWLSRGGGGRPTSSSSASWPVGLETAEPPPSRPLLTDGVFSESLHSSSSPVNQTITNMLIQSRLLTSFDIMIRLVRYCCGIRLSMGDRCIYMSISYYIKYKSRQVRIDKFSDKVRL